MSKVFSKKVTTLDGETYQKYALIASAFAVLLTLVLYLTSAVRGAAWGSAIGVSTALTLLALFRGGDSKIARVLVRMLAWLLALVGFIAMIGCVTALLLFAEGFDTPSEPWLVGLTVAMSLNLLPLTALPILAALAKVGRPLDVWFFRVIGVLTVVVLALGCIFGSADRIAWGVDNLYFKLFTCLAVALVPAFSFLIPTRKRV